jgi:hypothetical protein
MAMGFETALLTGIAELLDEYGVAEWSSGAVSTVEPAIYLGRLPDAPDRAIALASYPAAADPWLTDSIVGVQVRLRGTVDPGAVRDLAGAVFDALHGLYGIELGTGTDHALWVQMIDWQSGAMLGPDRNGRQERAENYYVTINRPSTRLE